MKIKMFIEVLMFFLVLQACQACNSTIEFHQKPYLIKYSESKSEGKEWSILQWITTIIWPQPVEPAKPTTTRNPMITSTTTTSTTSSTSTTSTTTAKPPSDSLPIRECTPCLCGTANTEERIIGGHPTRMHQYPWMAIVEIFNSFYCGGSLINDLYVLTAAHCVKGTPKEYIIIRLMEHDRRVHNSDVIIRNVAHTLVHEKFNSYNFDNDIALIRLDRPVNITGLLRPICWPSHWHTYADEMAIVTGWGSKTLGGNLSDILHETNVTILSHEACLCTSYEAGDITENMLCAGHVVEGGRDACHGDSGGPLHVRINKEQQRYHNEQYLLAGIVSWGNGCARPNAPGVYTRVGQYEYWLMLNTPGACECWSNLDQEDL